MNRMIAAFVSSLLLLSGCMAKSASSDPAAVDAANKWWKQATETAKPEKAGAVTPAHKITTNAGKVYNIPRHVQTKKEEADQVEDARWAAHKRAIVRGFATDGSTILVLTNLSPADAADAKELCHNVGAFIWARDNRHFGLDNITVLGTHNERLSYRIGLKGDVR
jgi:hypothetical protein